jgi:hypothetical protein
MNERGPWTGHLTKPAQHHVCEDGWICEQHPEKGWPHDDCPGPRAPCLVCQWPDGLPANRWRSIVSSD